MAGHKTPRTKDDKTKKRKRELNENDPRSKRPKADGKDKVNGAQPGVNGLTGAIARAEATGDRQLEVIRQFDTGEAGWRVSKPMGGRMLDIDPILTQDEQHLILTYNTSIQVFSAVDSLLVRRIPISTLDTSAPKGTKPAHIVATRVSKLDSNFLWVACSDGRVFHVDWTTTTKAPESFQTRSGTARSLTVLTTNIAAKMQEVLLISESDKPSRIEVVMYQATVQDTPESKSLLVMKKPGNGLQLLETSEDSQIVAGAFNDRLFIGIPQQQAAESFDRLQFDFYAFDTPDLLTTLDLRVYTRSVTGKKGRSNTTPVVDIIAGGARGSIYLYHDALARIQALEKSGSESESIQAQKFHWHRKAVHTVKWSRDGHYMISGGSENVLVLWQIDTGKKDFLPHLSGSVENVVVSASGASYVIHLDDNSTMILSTAEMKPSAYISGIQSAAVNILTPKDLLVQRTWTAPENVRRPIPAAIRPTNSSKLHVCVGNGRQATLSGDFSAPLLQTFDLETFTSVSRQALARTQPTDVNITNKGNPIDEPLITHVAFSADGQWLASVDQWEPSSRDVDNVTSDLKDQFIHERREVYLKFWDAREGEEQVALVSRINTPHATSRPEAVLDLASNPASSCFATIGGDGVLRLWRPKPRLQDGIAVKDLSGEQTYSWACSQIIALGEGLSQDVVADLSEANVKTEPQGSVTFSEDGSTIFVAFGTVDTGAVYVIDATSGEVVKILEGLWKGRLHSIRALSPFVVVLSDDLRVYDVVSDELRFGILMPKSAGPHELLQLAVDHTSGHFAVSLPVGDFSSIGVFDPEEPEPLLVRSTPHRIISLVSAPKSSGFVALDDAAQVWVVAEGSDPTSLATVQPLEDLRLESSNETVEDSGDVTLMEEDAEMESDEEEQTEPEDVEMEDDDIQPSVVHQQQLSDIFDAAPAFAAPSIEDLFYKVTDLLATKPLSASSA